MTVGRSITVLGAQGRDGSNTLSDRYENASTVPLSRTPFAWNLAARFRPDYTQLFVTILVNLLPGKPETGGWLADRQTCLSCLCK
jgi:hypothetical protein